MKVSFRFIQNAGWYFVHNAHCSKKSLWHDNYFFQHGNITDFHNIPLQFYYSNVRIYDCDIVVVTSLTLLCILDWSIVLHDFEDKDLITMFENHPKMSDSKFQILAFSTNFCPIKSYISGNTVWKVASDFQKLAKLSNFWHFQMIFCPLKV